MMYQALIVAIVFFSISWVISNIINRIALSKERLKLIEKNIDVKGLKSENGKTVLSNFNSLKYGLVAIGLSIGCLIGSFFEQNEVLANPAIGYFFSISLFVGIALVLSHYLVDKKEKRQAIEEEQHPE